METVTQKIEVQVHSRFNRLLATLILFIVLPPFLIDLEYLKYFILALLIFVVIGSTLVLFHNTKRRIISIAIAALTLWFAVENKSSILPYEIFKEIWIAIFFLATDRKIVLHIFKVQNVSVNVIVGAISAYLLLGIVGSILFTLIEIIYPNSFNVPDDYHSYYKMIYFSFVTLTTLGYGDITPQTPQAKSIVVLVTLTGQLYLAVLMAMLVGKFLSDQSKK